MWSSLALRASHLVVTNPTVRSSVVRNGTKVAVKCAPRFFSGEVPYAVDAPDGEHDFQDIEESSSWAKRTIDVASVTEDADAITEMHHAVLEKQMFAVDGPDGEHDLEDVEEHLAGVHRIINSASVLEDANEIKKEHEIQEEIRRQTLERSFENAKY